MSVCLQIKQLNLPASYASKDVWIIVQIKNQQKSISVPIKSLPKDRIFIFTEITTNSQISINPFEKKSNTNLPLALVTLPLSWFPHNTVVTDWFPFKGNNPNETSPMVLLSCHIRTQQCDPFKAPFGRLLVTPGWQSPQPNVQHIPPVSNVQHIPPVSNVQPIQHVQNRPKSYHFLDRFFNIGPGLLGLAEDVVERPSSQHPEFIYNRNFPKDMIISQYPAVAGKMIQAHPAVVSPIPIQEYYQIQPPPQDYMIPPPVQPIQPIQQNFQIHPNQSIKPVEKPKNSAKHSMRQNTDIPMSISQIPQMSSNEYQSPYYSISQNDEPQLQTPTIDQSSIPPPPSSIIPQYPQL